MLFLFCFRDTHAHTYLYPQRLWVNTYAASPPVYFLLFSPSLQVSVLKKSNHQVCRMTTAKFSFDNDFLGNKEKKKRFEAIRKIHGGFNPHLTPDQMTGGSDHYQDTIPFHLIITVILRNQYSSRAWLVIHYSDTSRSSMSLCAQCEQTNG